jgi:acyl-CoA reductase-like NAD-dependent aldehyde dehydrogenase
MTSAFQMLIDGALIDGATSRYVINPSSEEVIAEAPCASLDQLNQAVAAAKAAFPAWATTPIDARRKAVLAGADAIEANKPALARLLTQEQGKPLVDAIGEVEMTVGLFRYAASLDLSIKILADDVVRRVEAHPVPLGVIAAIVPWNFPLALMAFKVPAALVAGNTVIVKPAATTPLSTLMLGKLMAPLFPAGVLSVIADANDLGDALTRHPDIAKISFTGSTATGKRVMAGAAETLKRVTLELGGNDPAIVLDDVDVKATAPLLFGSAFANSGQVCIAIKRLYVHDAIYDEMCDELAALAERAIVGDGLEQGVQFGPLQNKQQFDRVRELIEDGRVHGRIIAGGEAHQGSGYFINPTVVRDISDGTRLVDEEQFGPVLPVIRFSDPQDAIARANTSPFGLGGSVWSADVDRATILAAQVDSGTVWVNKHLDIAPDIPFGGTKASGLGTELGVDSLYEFTQRRIINIAKSK